MTRGQVLLISLSIAAVASLFIFGKTKPSDIQKGQPATAGAQVSMPGADFSAIIQQERNKIKSQNLEAITALEEELKNSTGNNKVPVLQKIVSKSDTAGAYLISGSYQEQLAQLTNAKKDWVKAGDRFYAASQRTEAPMQKQLIADKAAAAYKTALTADPADVDPQIMLAAAYAENNANVMQAVTILKDVVAKDPENTNALMILGRLSITSGQYDKAITRLEKVVELEPKNTEALYFLAEAYKGAGNKTKAVELFEKCKKLVNNPAFDHEIDNYIKAIKNS